MNSLKIDKGWKLLKIDYLPLTACINFLAPNGDIIAIERPVLIGKSELIQRQVKEAFYQAREIYEQPIKA